MNLGSADTRRFLWPTLACVGVFICLIAGIAASGIPVAETLKDAKPYVLLAVALGGIALFGAWRRVEPAAILLALFAILSVQFVEVSAFIAMPAFLLASAVVGQRIGRRFGVADLLLATFIGIFVLTGVIGWTLPYKIHTRWVYTVLLAGLLWLERRAARDVLLVTWRGCADALSRSKAAASLALVVAVASLSTAWLPSIFFDDLAYHSMLPTQLIHLGYYRFDVATQVWAVAPWASDIVHAVVGVLANTESRGAVNIGWFWLACCALWRFGALIGLSDKWKWLGIALYASQPYISGLFGTAQVENELVPLTLALAILCVRICRDKDPNAIHALVILAGLFAALKASQALVIAPFVLVCVPALFKANLRKLLLAAAIALALGSSSYVYAWLATGNPLLPLFNAYFKSPFFPVTNFHDGRWSQGLNWRSVWDLTFATDKYQETSAGGAGLSVLALSIPLLATLAIAALRRTTLWLLLALVGMFAAIQYLRYIAPLLIVAIPLALFAIDRYVAPKIATGAVVILVVANLVLIPTSIYLLRDKLLHTQLSSLVKRSKGDANEQILRNYAFETVAAAHLLKDPAPARAVFLADKERPFTAPFAGRAFAQSWYDTYFSAAGAEADADLTGERWKQLLSLNGIGFVLAKNDPADRPALHAVLRAEAVPTLVGPAHTLYCLCKPRQPAAAGDALYKTRDLSARLRLF